MVLALLDCATVRSAFSADTAIMNIISDGVSDYFNGVCSAQDAARVIQSRVSILVSERG